MAAKKRTIQIVYGKVQSSKASTAWSWSNSTKTATTVFQSVDKCNNYTLSMVFVIHGFSSVLVHPGAPDQKQNHFILTYAKNFLCYTYKEFVLPELISSGSFVLFLQLTWVSVTTSTMVGYLDSTEVAQVVQLLKDGTSICPIATRFALSPSAVLRVWWRFQETGSYSRRAGQGCRRFLTPQQVSAPLCKEEQDEHCQSPTAVNVSDQTIRNRPHEGGLRARRPVVGSVLTGQHHRARLAFATEHQNWQIRHISFSQHDWFGGGSVMVWGGIFLEGRTDLYRLDNGSLTAIRYQDEILGPVVRPYAGAVGPGFLLVHNNAWPHVARVCRQFLENEGIDTIDWPTSSPDLNPIEHPWDIMFRSIRRHQVPLQTVQELSDALVQIWEEIPQDTIRERLLLLMNTYIPLAFAMISDEAQGTGRLIRVKGRMNGVMYHKILSQNLFPSRQPQNISGLEEICMEEWAKIPATVCADLVKTYRKRLTSVIANKENYKDILAHIASSMSTDTLIQSDLQGFILHQQMAKIHGKASQKLFRETLLIELSNIVKKSSNVAAQEEPTAGPSSRPTQDVKCMPAFFSTDATAARRKCEQCRKEGKRHMVIHGQQSLLFPLHSRRTENLLKLTEDSGHQSTWPLSSVIGVLGQDSTGHFNTTPCGYTET
ncbi:hypothetical protein NFI96_009961 [Prochilodus magdalenae]|nr:hypothetical protein NFI96_009961 [Prochilodus magdalenae]